MDGTMSIFFIFLMKLVNSPNRSLGLTIPRKHFPITLDCSWTVLIQNSVSLIRISRFWKHLPTKTLISHHLSVKPSWVAFRRERSEPQKVSISQILLTTFFSWIEMEVRVGKCRKYPGNCCLPFLVCSTQCPILSSFLKDFIY